MKVTIDVGDLKKLGVAMGRYAQLMPTAKANNLLRKAVKPMFRAAQSEVPVSNAGRERISLGVRGKVRGSNAHLFGKNPNANAYRRGGATRRDLRIKTVQPLVGEVGRVLVGVSKRGDKVGWRTVFITEGTKNRKTKAGANRGKMTANNFLERAYNSGIAFARADFQKEYREAFVSWARTTWPQIGV